MWEIIIISVTGLIALAYLIIFFIRQPGNRNIYKITILQKIDFICKFYNDIICYIVI